MAFFSEIFFSALVGRPVYTVDEKYYGIFRDFIVKRQNGNFVVTKVRIRTPDNKRVILAWSTVHSIDADPVSLKLTKKLEDIFALDYDEDELRLKRDFLDQQIIDTNAHRVVRVNDLKIVMVKDECFMVAADIGSRGLMRRIGVEQWALSLSKIFKRPLQNVLIPSKYIDPFPARIRHDITLNVAQDELKKMHPADLADIMTDLDDFERVSIIQTLPVETVARAIAELDPEIRKELLGRLKDETVRSVVERLAPDAATDIMSELPKRRMHHLLTTMKTTAADEIRELLKFKEDTAGSLMNTDFVALPETFTAREALDELRKKGEHAEQIFYLYIVDKDEVLKGAISLRKLIFLEPDMPLSSLVKSEPVSVANNENVDAIVEKFTKYNLIAMPVIDEQKHLTGIITVDDVLKVLQEAQ